MNIQYADVSIIVTPKMFQALKSFAIEVMVEMQKEDKHNANFWTACHIDFEGIQPRFMWGSIEDMPDDPHAVVTNLPRRLKPSGNHRATRITA